LMRGVGRGLGKSFGVKDAEDRIGAALNVCFGQLSFLAKTGKVPPFAPKAIKT
jgi:hypothetical protein